VIDVRIYSKEDCHLCDEAKEVLARVRRDIPFTLNEMRIAPGDPSYEMYKEMIPVVTINGALAFRYRVNEQELRRALRDASG